MISDIATFANRGLLSMVWRDFKLSFTARQSPYPTDFATSDALGYKVLDGETEPPEIFWG